MKWWSDFLSFRRFVTPRIMPVVFWILVFIAVVEGIVQLVWGARHGNALALTGGILTLLFGPVIARILCEWILTFFR